MLVFFPKLCLCVYVCIHVWINMVLSLWNIPVTSQNNIRSVNENWLKTLARKGSLWTMVWKELCFEALAVTDLWGVHIPTDVNFKLSTWYECDPQKGCVVVNHYIAFPRHRWKTSKWSQDNGEIIRNSKVWLPTAF